MAADGGDHLPLCRYNAVYGFARTSGAVSMTAPNLGCHCAAWRRLVLFRIHHCLQFRLRAMVEREALSVFLEDYAFSPLRCPIVIARSFCYVDLPCTHAWGGGLLQRH